MPSAAHTWLLATGPVVTPKVGNLPEALEETMTRQGGAGVTTGAKKYMSRSCPSFSSTRASHGLRSDIA